MVKKIIKFTKIELDTYVLDKNSCILLTPYKMHINMSPKGFVNKQTVFTDYFMNILTRTKIGRYDKQLNGIILDIKNIKIMDNFRINNEYPDLHIDFMGDFYTFQPTVGAIIKGSIALISDKGIRVIIYRVFNVSIHFVAASKKLIGDLKMHDEITFKIKKFDLNSLPPYIEGELIDDLLSNSVPVVNKKIVFTSDNEEEDVVVQMNGNVDGSNAGEETVMSSEMESELGKKKKMKKKKDKDKSVDKDSKMEKKKSTKNTLSMDSNDDTAELLRKILNEETNKCLTESSMAHNHHVKAKIKKKPSTNTTTTVDESVAEHLKKSKKRKNRPSTSDHEEKSKFDKKRKLQLTNDSLTIASLPDTSMLSSPAILSSTIIDKQKLWSNKSKK